MRIIIQVDNAYQTDMLEYQITSEQLMFLAFY